MSPRTGRPAGGWRDADGAPITVGARVQQVTTNPRWGVPCSRLGKRGEVLGWGATRLLVRFEGEDQPVSIIPHQVRITTSNGGPALARTPAMGTRYDRWRDARGTHIPVGARVEQAGTDARRGALCSRLGQRGEVIGRGTTRLLVRFEGEDQTVSVRPHLVRVLAHRDRDATR
ncbi:MAG: hypothetical protein ACRDRX_21400 [Pseudonocardiaceae bacterium]